MHRISGNEQTNDHDKIKQIILNLKIIYYFMIFAIIIEISINENWQMYTCLAYRDNYSAAITLSNKECNHLIRRRAIFIFFLSF